MPARRAAAAKAATKGKSLVEFAHHKKTIGCKVCALPAELAAQVADAKGKKISTALILEWLRSECDIKITTAEYDAHRNGRHVRGE